ncbi:MAG: hypothetical protein ACK4GR_01685 [bacterium]
MYVAIGGIPSEIAQNQNLRKINYEEYGSLKRLEEIILQTGLFSKNQIFVIENFSKALEENNPTKILDFLKKLKSSNVIINLDNLNLIKSQEIKNYLQENFKIIDKSKTKPKEDLIKNFISILQQKYGLENYENIEKMVYYILEKTNYDFLLTERIIDDILFKCVDSIDEDFINKISETNQKFLDFFILQYKENNLFYIVNLFLEILLKKDNIILNKNYELLKIFLDEIEIEGKIEEFWGLIFSQIVAIVRIYHEYKKVGDNLKMISNNLRMNYYRVMMLMKFVRNLDYLVKYEDFKVENLFSKILDSELKIKSLRSNYRVEIESFISNFERAIKEDFSKLV